MFFSIAFSIVGPRAKCDLQHTVAELYGPFTVSVLTSLGDLRCKNVAMSFWISCGEDPGDRAWFDCYGCCCLSILNSPLRSGVGWVFRDFTFYKVKTGVREAWCCVPVA